MDPRIALSRRKRKSKPITQQTREAYASGEITLAEALGLDDEDLQSIRTCASQLLSAGETRKSRAALELLLRLGERGPEIYLALAEVARLSGEQPQALTFLSAAKQALAARKAELAGAAEEQSRRSSV